MTRLGLGIVGALLLRVATPLAEGPAEARYQAVPFEDGEPSSLYWNAEADTLYIADNENNQLWTWTDAAGLKKLATTPDPLGAQAAHATLVGQVVRLKDGTLVVMRFGKPGGGYGGIAFVNPVSGAAGVVPNTDPNRKRIGLAATADGRLFGSYFRGAAGGGQEGAVTRIDLEAGESDFAPGFKKIVGVLADGDTLFVSDQMADAIYALPLGGASVEPGKYRLLARLPRPDQLALGPDGSLFTGQFQAAPGSSASLAVRQVLRDGTVEVFAQDPDVTRPSGLAYDAKRRRLFVANGGNPAQCSVRIFTVP